MSQKNDSAKALQVIRADCKLRCVPLNGLSLQESVRNYFEFHQLGSVPNTKNEIRAKIALLYNDGTIKGKPSPARRKIESQPFYDPNSFYCQEPWLLLRKRMLNLYGTRCMKCGKGKGVCHVDHIKPRSRFKELELDPNNMQILCEACNMEKSNKNEIDYRPDWAKNHRFLTVPTRKQARAMRASKSKEKPKSQNHKPGINTGKKHRKSVAILKSVVLSEKDLALQKRYDALKANKS